MKIKCISLWQPWASLVAHGAKKIETRSWRCPLPAGTLLAIHAARKWDRDLARMIEQPPFRETLHGMGVGWLEGCAPNLPFGAVTCVVRLGGCLPIVGTAKPPKGQRCVGFDEEKILRVWHPFDFGGVAQGHSGDGHQQLAEHEADFGNFNAGRFAWLFDAVVRLEKPAAERGRQSIWEWEVPEELLPAVGQLQRTAS